MAKCTLCNLKKAVNAEKKLFLLNKALSRAKQENQDYAVYMEEGSYKISDVHAAIQRGEQIVQVISRFEKPTAL
jgi:ssDNA-binding replication factor A large subunit